MTGTRYRILVGLITGFILLGAMPEMILADTKMTSEKEAATQEMDGFEEDFEALDPFASVDTTVLETPAIPQDQGPLSVNGFVKLESEYGYNKSDEKLSNLTPQLYIEANYKISDKTRARVSGRGFYDLSHDIMAKDDHHGFRQDDEVYEVELKDAWLDGQVSDRLSYRIGRQIIAWGDSDYARITDVINPRDQTSPGLIDLEDARLSVAATRLTFDTDPWVFEAASVHQYPGSKISGKGGDFDYYKVLRSPLISISDKDTPGVSLENTGIAAKVRYAFNGGDVSFMAASTYDSLPVLRYDGMAGGSMAFTPEYDRFTTLGFSSSLVKGSVLYKLETAFRMDREMARNDILTQIGSGLPAHQVRTTNSEDQISALAGFEYTGITDLRLCIETQVTHTLNYKSDLSADENEFATYFQATRDFFNEILELDLFWVILNPGNGNILRLSTTYDLADNWEIQAGVVFYDADRSSTDLHPYIDQDRVFARVKFSF